MGMYHTPPQNIEEKGLTFCQSEAATANCTECTSHQKENATEFINRLGFLIKRAITKLN
ncbi:hypothetical protein PAMP_023049 [Pampus punctatissimus]